MKGEDVMVRLYTEEELQKLQDDYIAWIRWENWEEVFEEILAEIKSEYYEICDELKKDLERGRSLDEMPREEALALMEIYDSMDETWNEIQRFAVAEALDCFRNRNWRLQKRAERRRKGETDVLAAARRITRKQKRQIAKNILAKEAMTFHEIAECVGLPVAEVEKLATARRRRLIY